jgi:hypothetical protein
MKKPRRDPIREDRIEKKPSSMPDRKSRQWAGVTISKIKSVFPFLAKCIAADVASPLRKGETVEAVRMAPEDNCEHDMFVLVRWQGRKMAVPLSQLAAINPDEPAEEAIGDWHYLWRSVRRDPSQHGRILRRSLPASTGAD